MAIDLTGQRFHRLLVRRSAGKGKHGYMWECVCDCGSILEKSTSILRSGHAKSCGCLRTDRNKEKAKLQRKDIAGQRFGMLVAIEDVGKKRGSRLWRMRCDCGMESLVTLSDLVTGNTKSCGCLAHSPNAEDLSGMHVGILKVISRVGSKGRKALWRCECVLCGEICERLTQEVKSEHNGCPSCRENLKRDIAGERFGLLVAMSETDPIIYSNGQRVRRYICDCDCGNTYIARLPVLRRGSVRSCGCLLRRTGEDHPRWNSDISNEDREDRRLDPRHAEWSRLVKERDGFTCQVCGVYPARLASHHLAPYSTCKALRYVIDNGVTMCINCHSTFHIMYGKRSCTRGDYYEFAAKEAFRLAQSA